MRRSMKWLTMAAVLTVAGLALAAAADYAIQLNRPMKAGDTYHISATGKESVKEVTSIDGKAQPDSVREESITIDGSVKVLEVDKNGQPSKISMTVERCLIKQGAEEKPLAKGTVVTGSVKDGKDVFEIDGKPAGDLDDILGLLFTLGKGEASDDEIFGTKDRKKVGDSWAINSALAAKDLQKDDFKAAPDDIKGTVTVEKAVKSGDTDCLQMKGEVTVSRFDMSLPPSMKVEKGAVHLTMVSLLPIDTSKGMQEQTMDLSMTVALKGKPQEDGPELATELTATRTCKISYSYPK
jgi:hypothetical protein